LEISRTRQGAVTVVKPAGPLVGSDSEQFALALGEVAAESLGRFVVDASAVAFADSRGLEVLVEAGLEQSGRGQALRLCGAGETLREVLELTDLAGMFEHYADVNTGVRSFL
jgi:anti-anti-sigma factor